MRHLLNNDAFGEHILSTHYIFPVRITLIRSKAVIFDHPNSSNSEVANSYNIHPLNGIEGVECSRPVLAEYESRFPQNPRIRQNL